VQALIQAMTGAAEERMRRREYMARETERELARAERRERFEWEKTRAQRAFEAAERERGLSAQERRQRMALIAAKYFEETGERLPGAPGVPAAEPGVPGEPRRSMRELRDAYVDVLRRQGVSAAEATQAAKGLSRKTLIDELQRARAVGVRLPTPELEEEARIRGPFEPKEWFTWLGAPIMGAQAELTRALTREPGEFPGAGPGFRPALEAPFQRAREQRLRAREAEVLGLAAEAERRAEALERRTEQVLRAFAPPETARPALAPMSPEQRRVPPRLEGPERISPRRPPAEQEEFLGEEAAVRRYREGLEAKGFEPQMIEGLVQNFRTAFSQGG
jgi:hypothetical protein